MPKEGNGIPLLCLGRCFTPLLTSLTENEQLFPLWEGSVWSNCCIFADPSAISSALTVVTIGLNATISCTSNSSKSYPGYFYQPHWTQIDLNGRLLHQLRGRDGAVNSKYFKGCQFVTINATSQNSGIYECWSLYQVSNTAASKINFTFHKVRFKLDLHSSTNFFFSDANYFPVWAPIACFFFFQAKQWQFRHGLSKRVFLQTNACHTELQSKANPPTPTTYLLPTSVVIGKHLRAWEKSWEELPETRLAFWRWWWLSWLLWSDATRRCS